MPRGPRLDAPGTLHHVMVRGIERRFIFRDDADRADFTQRLGRLAEASAVIVYAWVLLPNHAHLLIRTGGRPLARTMRSLLTGYAGSFNRRHGRVGHLFQNRYKSVVVEEEAYFLELVRYLHLNPIRARVVADLAGLARYPWSGHIALLGRTACPWQATAEVLAHFGDRQRAARQAYRKFVDEGVARGRRPELQGGGLIRSFGGWRAVAALRRGREEFAGDERVLGSSEFVEAMQREVAAREAARPKLASVEDVINRICRALQLDPEWLRAGSRKMGARQAREGIAYLWVEAGGRSGRKLAPLVGVSSQAIYKAAARGRTHGEQWQQLLKTA
jgi:putative transposase